MSIRWCCKCCYGSTAIRARYCSTQFHTDSLASDRLFIHIMPCATLHVMVHLLPREMLLEKFPAVHTIKFSPPNAPEHYNLSDMIIWATLPYAIWQLSYHFLITVRKRTKIAAGRPTSFTWLRKSYRNNPLGKFVLSFPESLQESVFMGIQYSYALLTMLPCPIWFWYRWASAGFLMVVFAWACWNGATYYIDVFGRRMEKELEQLKRDVAKMSQSPGMGGETPAGSPEALKGMDGTGEGGKTSALDLGPAASGGEGRSASEPGADAKEVAKHVQANGNVGGEGDGKKNE